MKVIYPGPAVAPAERDKPTLHPAIGILQPGENDVDPLVAAPLIESGFFALPPGSSRPTRGAGSGPSRPSEE